MIIETWKEIDGYKNEYHISSIGRVKSLDKIIPHWKGGNRLIKGKLLRQVKRKDGYLHVNLSSAGKVKMKSVHRLVATAFILNTQCKLTVNHKNGIKTDNRLENLEWATYKENQRHAIRTGLIVYKKGDERHTSKLTYKKADEIRKIAKSLNYPALADMFSVSRATICNVVNRKYWVR